jgi:hypothetical protein
MKNQLLIIAIILIFVSCKKENDLKKTITVYDSEFTDLPEYSEWGYNTFGAYYDREVFISTDEKVPAKVILTDSILSFVLEGRKGNSYYDDGSNGMKMTFNIKGFTPGNYTDMKILNDTVFNLKDTTYKVLVTIDTTVYTANILSGQLFIKRARNLLVDNKQVEVILSGYFDFKALINGSPVTISEGRFDVGIGPDNFYIY